MPPFTGEGAEAGSSAEHIFYVWLDAPVGYFGSFRNYADRRSAEGQPIDVDAFLRPGGDNLPQPSCSSAIDWHRSGAAALFERFREIESSTVSRMPPVAFRRDT